MLELEITGAQEAPVIVLLHPIATSRRIWNRALPHLTARARIVAVDLPGHGESPPAEQSFDAYADAVLASLQAAGVSRFTLVGVSFGAMVAMTMAVRAPTKISGIVLACCSAYTPPPLAEIWQKRVDDVAKAGMAIQLPDTLERWLTPEFLRSEPGVAEWVAGFVRATPVEGFQAAARLIAGLDHREVLARIGCPSLVVAGTHDRAANPVIMAELAAAIPGSSFLQLDAAHFPMVEAPEAFATLVTGFADGRF